MHFRRCAPGPAILPSSCLEDGVDSGGQARVEIALAEPRFDLLLNNRFGRCVRNSSFQPISDLQVNLPVLDEDKENRPVVFALLADSPSLSDPDGVVLDGGIRLHLGIDHDHDLAGIRPFEIL